MCIHTKLESVQFLLFLSNPQAGSAVFGNITYFYNSERDFAANKALPIYRSVVVHVNVFHTSTKRKPEANILKTPTYFSTDNRQAFIFSTFFFYCSVFMEKSKVSDWTSLMVGVVAKLLRTSKLQIKYGLAGSPQKEIWGSTIFLPMFTWHFAFFLGQR